MEKLIFLRRCIQNKNPLLNIPPKFIQNIRFSSSSENDDKNKKENEVKKSEDALNKLNNLLKTMITEDLSKTESKLNLAKPKNRRKKDLQEKKSTPSKDSTEKQIIDAVKGVAESIGGNVKQTESELLMKLLNTANEDKTATNLSDIVKGMKIEREDTPSHQFSRADQVRQTLEQKKFVRESSRTQKRHPITEKINLFGSEPLGIFTNIQAPESEGVQNEVWNNLYERDLKLAVTHPPSNYFQQMILWTEQGKVWKFPIDNEQGLEDEKKIYFTEHVFLDKHLEGWCPSKGPIRHFMELVCVGLSKNPYLTVEAKKEHIEWFRNYFGEKKQLLKDVGLSLEQDTNNSNLQQKQLE